MNSRESSVTGRREGAILELRLLGGLDLRRAGGEPLGAVLAQPKRLALLAWLALAPGSGYTRRDTIAALLWPEQDQEHARGSLRQALRFLRRELGEEAIRNRGDEEIGLDSALVWCDAVAFQQALEAGAVEDTAALYRGELLESFFVSGVSAEFEQWLEAERSRFRTLAGGALWTATTRLAEREALAEAIATARQAVRLSPDDEAGFRRLLSLLDRAGDRAGAIAAYGQFAERLQNEYSAEPAAETQRLIEAIRVRSEPHRSEPHRSEPHNAAAPPSRAAGDRPPAGPSVSDPGPPRRRISRALFAGAGILVAAAGYLGVTRRPTDRPSAPVMTVAVLPVRDLTGDTAAAVLSEALTDELITRLAQLPTLRVINRRTMMQYRDSTGPPEAVARGLGAGAVVLTTLQRSGDSVELRAQLVLGRDATIAWAGGFSGRRHQAYTWVREAALAVGAKAGVRLTSGEQTLLATARPVNPEAFEWYARGRWWWNKRGRANLRRADDYFHRALDIEPTYALAWSGLADTYAQMGYGGDLPPEEAFSKAKAMARRALELDSTLAEPHAALGYSLMYYDWDWPGAEREFRLAIARNPSYATAHEWFGLFLAAMGRFGEAEQEGRIAQELDPLSAAVAGTRGWILHYAGRDAESLRILRGGVRTDSTNGIVRLYLGRVHQAMGQFDSATAHFAATGPLRSWVPNVAGEGTVAARVGRSAQARQLIRYFDSLSATGEYVTPYAVALVFNALGDQDSAIARLEAAYRDRTHWLVWLNRDFRWHTLREDSRFAALTRRIGLPK